MTGPREGDISLVERWRTRIPSWRVFLERAQIDRRLAIYDLLPMIWTPRARDVAAAVVAFFQPKSPWPRPTNQARSWARDLAWQGLVPLPALDGEVAAEIRAYFQGVRCSDPFRPHLGAFPWDQPASDETNMGYYAVQDILAAPHVLALLNDPTILDVAELYLGCKPVLDNIGCWWSYGDRPAAKGTQRYHRDWDSLKGFKLFFYLTDVGEEDGPHVFVRGSHRDPRLAVGKALSDEVVHRVFGADKVATVTGPAGTRFLADTFGFHKGQLPRGGRRLILTAQYNVHSSPHTPRQPWLPRDSHFDPDVNRRVMKRR
ncbi:hypothetical protein [Nitrospirillum viridazoti]|uniref:hypothetical protein n=1 Tax=Nitrospirillum viridazoti TaxID=3144925 RepID=UPI0011A22A19|nr:hypothetical protein [Nitrospirillum amazonense]